MPTHGVLPDGEIEKAAEHGWVKAAAPFVADQIQPASLDLRLSDKVFRVRASFLPGAGVKVAHYWQEAEDLLPDATVLDEVIRGTRLKLQEARDLLGRMLFSGEDVFKSVGVLSGGERSRLALARLTGHPWPSAFAARLETKMYSLISRLRTRATRSSTARASPRSPSARMTLRRARPSVSGKASTSAGTASPPRSISAL